MSMLLQEIIVGRPRDGSDRVSWLLEHSRFEQALDIIETDVTLSQATREQVRLPMQQNSCICLGCLYSLQ